MPASLAGGDLHNALRSERRVARSRDRLARGQRGGIEQNVGSSRVGTELFFASADSNW